MEKIDWYLTWTMVSAIATILMALIIGITAYIAWNTLLKTRGKRQEEVVKNIEKIFVENEYPKCIKRIDKRFDSDGKLLVNLENNAIEYIKAHADYIMVIKFLQKVNKLLESKVITMNNLEDYFTIDFPFESPTIMMLFYIKFKKLEKELLSTDYGKIFYHLNFLNGEYKNNEIFDFNIIDNFFFKIALYQNNNELMNLIKSKNFDKKPN